MDSISAGHFSGNHSAAGAASNATTGERAAAEPSELPNSSLRRASSSTGLQGLQVRAVRSSGLRHLARSNTPPSQTIDYSSCLAHSESTSGRFKADLKAWEKQGHPGENRAQAVHEILNGCTYLKLSHMGLTTVPPFPPGTWRIELDYNRLTTLAGPWPEGVTAISANNNIISGPLDIDALPKTVTCLWLAVNRITDVADSSHPGLEQINLENNQLRALHKQPPGLKILNVNYNKIMAIDDGILSTGLIVFSATHNRIRTLPRVFPAGMTSLNLAYNDLRDLSESLLKLPDNCDVNVTNTPVYRRIKNWQGFES
jgi:Leucine-rich repeat (LRR) protein